MGGEVLLDIDAAEDFAHRCRLFVSAVRQEKSTLRTRLFEAELHTDAVTLISELGDEIELLADYITFKIAAVKAADVYGPVPQHPFFDAKRLLRQSLSDEHGAAIVESQLNLAGWELADSFVYLDPNRWTHMVYPNTCEGFGESSYGGGGALQAPDGRLYPIVIPLYFKDGERYTNDINTTANSTTVASLGGQDRGWTLTGYTTGIVEYRDELSTGTALSITAGTMTGLRLPSTRPTDHLLPTVRFQPGMRPWMPTTPEAEAAADDSGAMPAAAAAPGLSSQQVILVDGRAKIINANKIPQQNRATRRAASRVGVNDTKAQRVNAVGGVLGFVEGAYNGMQFVKGKNGNRHAAYQVYFEENVDGRVRARVGVVNLYDSGTGVSMLYGNIYLNHESGITGRIESNYPPELPSIDIPGKVYPHDAIKP